MKERENPLEKLFNDMSNPIRDIEFDIGDLIKKCGALVHERDEYKIKTDSNIKKMLLDFLEAVDAFENVFKNIGVKESILDQQIKIWVGNFRTVYRLLFRALKAAGVIPIETIIGEKANPHWHNVVEVCKDPNKDNETIVEEIKKGYLWNGEILRMAEVKAVKNSV